MSIESDFVYLQGKVYALAAAVQTLIAAHPEPEKMKQIMDVAAQATITAIEDKGIAVARFIEGAKDTFEHLT